MRLQTIEQHDRIHALALRLLRSLQQREESVDARLVAVERLALVLPQRHPLLDQHGDAVLLGRLELRLQPVPQSISKATGDALRLLAQLLRQRCVQDAVHRTRALHLRLHSLARRCDGFGRVARRLLRSGVAGLGAAAAAAALERDADCQEHRRLLLLLSPLTHRGQQLLERLRLHFPSVHALRAMALEVHLHVGAPQLVVRAVPQLGRLRSARSAAAAQPLVIAVCIRAHDLSEWYPAYSGKGLESVVDSDITP